MNRRDFLKSSLLAVLYLTAARKVCFAAGAGVSDRILISLMLEGGPDFRHQIRNIYDTLACEDILNANVISTDYPGWDHHQNLKSRMEPMIGDIFGAGRGLHTLFAELDSNQPAMADRVVILVCGEFGRQLAANGGGGTDHGVGNSVLLIGRNVNGGIYGDMFPQSEIERFAQPGADIEGRTSVNQVIGRICEKIKPGSGDSVVPSWENQDLEPGVDLSPLFF
ncbi:MAG: DUF1501 domain-containing protein [Deltaproteobacteria bacterium]|nr:DUF1501 domain-containing protein [Deltaproteobacteria bacterium]